MAIELDEASEIVELFHDKRQGRGIKATSLIEPGTIIFMENPSFHVLEEEFRRIHCNFCTKKCEKLRTCRGCNFVYYCDRQCQISNYSNHQYECKFLKTAECKIDIRTRTLLISIQKHLKTQQKRSKKVVTHDAKGYPLTLGGLHIRQRDNSLAEDLESDLNPDMKHFWELVRTRSIPVTEDLVCQFEAMLNANVFSVHDEDQLTCLGEGVYFKQAMFNHSCRPNCAFNSNGRELQITCIRPIKPGEECCISYISLLSPTEVRQNKLKKWYGFDCLCERCMNDTDKVTALNHAVFVVLTSPTRDSLKRSNEQKWNLRKSGRKRMISYKGDLLKDCIHILALLDAVYQPYHLNIYKVLKKAMKLSLELGEIEKALDYSRRCISVMRTHLDPSDNKLAWIMSRVVQLEDKLGQTFQASPATTEASLPSEECSNVAPTS